MTPGLLEQIRQASNGNFALGSDRFAEEIAAALGRRVTPGKPGRPCKLQEAESGYLFWDKQAVSTLHIKAPRISAVSC